MSEKFKKALSIAVNVGCGFEADAEDAAELLTLITDLEARIAELEAHIDQLLEAGRKVSDAYERRYDSYSRETLEWEVLVSRLNDIAKWKEREE